jgi:hypothetical protein
VRYPFRIGWANKRLWFVAGLVILGVPACALPAVLMHQSPQLVAEFQTIQPGMTYQEVQAVLVRPHVAGPLAESFGTPNPDSLAELRGEPSFEQKEWGRVDSPSQYEAEWTRTWKVQNRLPLSTAERRRYTVRQWGVANTQSYCFIAVFDENEVLVCRYWTIPAESRLRGWLRRVSGW